MDEFIKLLDPAYELIQYRIKEDKVIFVNLKLYFEYINDILNIFLAEWEKLKSYFEYILRLHLKSLNYSLNIFSEYILKS